MLSTAAGCWGPGRDLAVEPHSAAGPLEMRFSPYAFNGGTDKTVIGCSGFHGDCLTLTKIIEARLKMYKHSNNKTMTTGAIAAMLSTILYSRRFFPYYVYNIIGGLDEEGKGAVYSFDPVGSYQRDSFKAGGSASAMLQPLLDNQEEISCPCGSPWSEWLVGGVGCGPGKRSDPGSSTEIRSASVTLSGAARWQCWLAQSKPPCHRRSDLQRSRLLARALPVHRLC
uniref:Proteasome 20S subunit beta 1 n=1 Tax=Felis catus TaxID=9685 RepID=A0ABI7YWB6_FELCA